MRKVLFGRLEPVNFNFNVRLKNTVVLYTDTLYYFNINKK